MAFLLRDHVAQLTQSKSRSASYPCSQDRKRPRLSTDSSSGSECDYIIYENILYLLQVNPKEILDKIEKGDLVEYNQRSLLMDIWI